jgi:hypothetical protein
MSNARAFGDGPQPFYGDFERPTIGGQRRTSDDDVLARAAALYTQAATAAFADDLVTAEKLFGEADKTRYGIQGCVDERRTAFLKIGDAKKRRSDMADVQRRGAAETSVRRSRDAAADLMSTVQVQVDARDIPAARATLRAAGDLEVRGLILAREAASERAERLALLVLTLLIGADQ